MSITDEIVAIAQEHGATDGATNIIEALDLLLDTLAGEDVDTPHNIAAAVAMMDTYITPNPLTATISITANGTGINVADYAKADVAVPLPTGNISITQCGTNINVNDYATATVNVPVITVTYDLNTGTGTVAPAHVAKGNPVTLNDGTGITAPDTKEFAGWATTAAAEEPDVTSPYTPTADVTLYAVYTAASNG